MDLVASPTSTSAQDAEHAPTAVTPEQARGRLPVQSDETPPRPLNETLGGTKPVAVKHLSSPEYNSPLRHHRRSPSTPKIVKASAPLESLNARSEYVTSQDDGAAEHRINQYIVKQEIGRGSFGAVHLAVDQYGTEYAVKEFSKARLRKRAQSNILRKPFPQRRRGGLQGFNSPLHRNIVQEGEAPPSSIDLIKEEIAIMKKLNHPNLVSLIEVLDDPSEDSLYMVMEMCKKGVVMRVGLDQRADPYPDHVCRYWFRDLILGIEYLHAQGVVHRDIKPDNCLVTDDDVLKVVDFGVSEMFSKDSEMLTAKSAGSPAFLPPELCIARHGDVSGRAADIWSMGVTLYCLKYGRIPFEKTQIFELYDAIKSDDLDLGGETNDDFRDLMSHILDKDPQKRIKMPELREHPWVTNGGTDKLLAEEENTSDLIEPPTEAEMNAAITKNMRNLLTVVKAVRKFKGLIDKSKHSPMTSILGDQGGAQFSHPPATMHAEPQSLPPKSHSFHAFGQDRDQGQDAVGDGLQRTTNIPRRPVPTLSVHDTTAPELAGAASPVYGNPEAILSGTSTDTDDSVTRAQFSGDVESLDPAKLPPFRSAPRHAHTTDETGKRGHAHDPLEDQIYLFVGPSTFSGVSSQTDDGEAYASDEDGVPIVSESPGAADMDIYETAYRDEIERIMAQAKEQNKEPNVYLTRRVDAKLMAISGLAGKWAAMGEEAKNQIKDYTQFSTRKAHVTEVSRALRHAAREEYEKRKHERRAWIAAEKEKANQRLEGPDSPTPPSAASPSPTGPDADDTAGRHSAVWKGKAADKGRQAKTSLLGLVDKVKTKSWTRSGLEES